MSMGGGSDDVRPIRSYGSRPAYSTGGDEPSAAGRAAETPRAEAADYSLPTYVGVGGGLSNRRIIKKMPQDLQGETPYESNLVKVIKYMISPEVAATDQDQVVEQAVRERIELSDCRLLINNPAGLEPPYNLGKEHLQDTLGTYLVKKTQRTGTGSVEVNYADIAVVTHDEGGGKIKYSDLEKLLK